MTKDPRIENLKDRIDQVKETLKLQPLKKVSSKTTSGKFFNVGVELTAGVLIGVGLGLFFDWLLNISPWGLITFFILGSAAGMMNVYRALMKEKPKNKKKEPHG